MVKNRIGPMLVMRRSAACGDIIQAFPIAHALSELGHDVLFQANPEFHPAIIRSQIHPIPVIPNSIVDIDLDNSYEQCRECLKYVSIRAVYFAVADAQLRAKGIAVEWASAPLPKMNRLAEPRAGRILAPYEKPWIMICPRSASPVNGIPRSGPMHHTPGKSIPDSTWEDVARRSIGTCFWLGVHGPPPEGIVDLMVQTISDTMAYIDFADVIVTVDTGTMHMAGAMRVPVVAVHQAYDPLMTFERCPNMTIVKSNVQCISCCRQECPINRDSPPCQVVSPEKIATAINGILKDQHD